MASKNKNTINRISKVEITDATLSNRGGLSFILRYIESVGFFKLIEKTVQGVRLSAKAKPVSMMVRQILAYFLDGTHKAISGFDHLRRDEGYAATLEVGHEDLVSSHAVKRFFGKFSFARCAVLRRVLNHLFVWRLQVLRPALVILDIDTEVLDNDDANCREGVTPTYKKKKGFQNLQITWDGKIIDAMFRRGTAHSNHGDDVRYSLKRVISLIRKHYSQSVPIIVTMDSGFLDEKNLLFLDNEPGVGFVCFGKLYDSVTEYVKGCDVQGFSTYNSGGKSWRFLEFGSRLKSWNGIGFLRTIYTSLLCDENGQMIMDFARPDSVIYTNIRTGSYLAELLMETGHAECVEAEQIIAMAHGRGNSELTNRSFKDFMTAEQLPFKRFGMNAAYYYLMVIGHFLMDCYNKDAVQGLVPAIGANCYPTTIRRRVIDFAATIVKSGNAVRLKITQATHFFLNAEKLWKRCCGSGLTPIPEMG